ncbi:MAG TPA: hypothetical protein VKA31_11480 [Mariprofundaceae bacterium]|nr:hypothetical protein [Mariprofundaceae bacterium]
MKSKSFYDLDHARAYLSNSMVLIRKRVAMIDNVAHGGEKGQFTLTFRYVSDPNTPRVINYPNPLVDFTPFPLGWYARKRPKQGFKAYYMSRRPTRGWKVGLTAHTLAFQRPGKPSGRYQPTDPDPLIWTREFDKMVAGEYESYIRAFRIVQRSKTSEVPFSRRFVVTVDGVFYRFLADPVANATADGPQLFDDYRYLAEALQEDMR